MRKIGDTHEGNFLVEMEPKEWARFVSLDAVIKGECLEMWSRDEFITGRVRKIDTTEILEVIASWIGVKKSFNLLLCTVQELDERFSTKEEQNA